MEDSGASLHEHSRTDSGFLSGGNLLSDQNLSSDDLSTPVSQKSAPELDVRGKGSASYMRLDSGVDVSLNDQLSSLSLYKNYDCNDLSCDVKPNSVISDSKTNVSLNIKERKQEEDHEPQPWELYFQQDEDGDTQLHIAIIQGFIEVVFNLIRMAPHPCFLDIRNSVVQCPLHLAVLTHQPRIARRLVVCGADPARLDSNGNTALHLACHSGDLECVRALTHPITVAEISAAEARHPSFTRQLPQDLEEINYDGEACVHLAAKEGHINILRHLTWFGADINARDGKSGRTALHYAVEKCDDEMLAFLLEDTAAGVDTPTYAGHSAYQLAAAINSSAAPVLLAHGAAMMDLDDDDDGHPDHNAEESDDEMPGMSSLHPGLGNFAHNQVPVL